MRSGTNILITSLRTKGVEREKSIRMITGEDAMKLGVLVLSPGQGVFSVRINADCPEML